MTAEVDGGLEPFDLDCRCDSGEPVCTPVNPDNPLSRKLRGPVIDGGK
jgi:hypothetical protein